MLVFLHCVSLDGFGVFFLTPTFTIFAALLDIFNKNSQNEGSDYYQGHMTLIDFFEVDERMFWVTSRVDILLPHGYVVENLLITHNPIPEYKSWNNCPLA